MSRLERAALHGANLLVVGTGVTYFVMKHLLEPADPFAVVGHPLQPQVQHLHVLAAPVLVFLAGLIWRSHVARRGRRRRRTGLLLALSFAPMAASGYLLQTAVEPTWRTVWLWVHLVSGGLWTLAYGGHVVAARVSAAAARRGRSAQPDPRSGHAAWGPGPAAPSADA